MSKGSYQNLIVWQKSYELSKHIYRLTEKFPDHERYGLTSQMRRAAISIPSNLAEGYRRQGGKELRQFTRVAFGSAAELETQLMLAKDLGLATKEDFLATEETLQGVLRLLRGFHDSLENNSTHHAQRTTH